VTDHGHDHDRGLAFDLATLVERRHALKLLAGSGLAVLVGCGSSGSDNTASGSRALSTSSSSATATGAATASSASSSASTSTTNCTPIPEETAGPYPGDGTNGPNVLNQSGIVRSDIRPSFGSASGTASGVPLTINLSVLDTSKSCQALAGAAVYLWHCDASGNYSLYSQGVTNQNYLRGVQETGSSGRVSFTSIFPACYAGRWPHIHFEVYPSLAQVVSAGNKTATSQLALPKEACDVVYATTGYEQSVRNLSQTSLARDMVFGDGADRQLGAVSGNVGSGFTVELTVPV
jgi:protocatechuate 3,4-dioxygenase beta subunit